MRAALYARYSDENQREESITAQLRLIRDYCLKKGYSIVKEYTDEAKTGRTDKRPGFQRMLRDAQIKMFDVVIVHKVNRFARNRISAAINKTKLLRRWSPIRICRIAGTRQGARNFRIRPRRHGRILLSRSRRRSHERNERKRLCGKIQRGNSAARVLHQRKHLRHKRARSRSN